MGEESIHLPEFLIPNRVGEELDYEAAGDLAHCRLFLVWLKDLDSRLDLLFAKPGAKVLDEGYWYIYRKNEGFPPSFWKVCNDDGSYCVPDERHIKRLQQIDSASHPDLWRQYEKRKADARRAGEKTSEEQHREFREKLEERLKSLYGTSIAVTPSMKALVNIAEKT
jgi:hypothetical protein